MPLYRLRPSSGGTNTILGHVATAPPTGTYPVTNLYWDPALNKLVGEYDDAGVGAGKIGSNPPVDKYAGTNVYFDPATGKLVGDYDDGV